MKYVTAIIVKYVTEMGQVAYYPHALDRISATEVARTLRESEFIEVTIDVETKSVVSWDCE